MALNYSVSLRKNPLNREAKPKAYATAQTNGELTLKELSHRVAQQTTVSRADVVAVLTSTVENMFDGLREGKQVDFGELGKFRLQIYSEGAESIEKFTSANIQGVTIQYLPGDDLKSLFQGLEFTPVASRKAQAAALRAEKSGKDVVDILDKPGVPPTPADPGMAGGDPGKNGGDPGKQGDPGKAGVDPGKQAASDKEKETGGLTDPAAHA